MKIHFALTAAILALTPVAATAETAEEQQACMNDAFTVCGDFIPDRDRVAACLARNMSRISAPCRTVMLRYQQPATAANAANAANASHPAKPVKPAAVRKTGKGPLNIKPKITATRAAARS